MKAAKRNVKAELSKLGSQTVWGKGWQGAILMKGRQQRDDLARNTATPSLCNHRQGVRMWPSCVNLSPGWTELQILLADITAHIYFVCISPGYEAVHLEFKLRHSILWRIMSRGMSSSRYGMLGRFALQQLWGQSWLKPCLKKKVWEVNFVLSIPLPKICKTKQIRVRKLFFLC